MTQDTGESEQRQWRSEQKPGNTALTQQGTRGSCGQGLGPQIHRTLASRDGGQVWMSTLFVFSEREFKGLMLVPPCIPPLGMQ